MPVGGRTNLWADGTNREPVVTGAAVPFVKARSDVEAEGFVAFAEGRVERTRPVLSPTAGIYEPGTSAPADVRQEINFGVNPTKYNTCTKSYLPNNNTSYTMNYSVKVNFNNT